MMENAYFTTEDERKNTIYDFTIPDAWWSRLYEYVWAERQIIPGQVVVDAGSGPNYPLQYVLADTCKVYSIDIDPNLLNSKPHENISHIVASIDKMPIPDASVDTVYCISVLEHLKRVQAEATLKEFYRVLKPGGRLILTMDLSVDSQMRYSWAVKPSEVFDMARGFSFGEYENEAPEGAIYQRDCGLYCYHAILRKGEV